MDKGISRLCAKIQNQFNALEHLLRSQDQDALAHTYTTISKWSIANHIDHLIAVNSGILKVIFQRRTAIPGKMNLIGYIVLFTNFMPRGRAQAPEKMVPTDRSASELLQELNVSRTKLEILLQDPSLLASPHAILPHPYFGALSAWQWLRFVAVHNHHHLKIVRELQQILSVKKDNNGNRK
jgi:hypothetical protein